MKRLSNLIYDQDRNLALDLYLPDTLNAKACVIYAHGDRRCASGYQRAEVGHFAQLLAGADLAMAAVQYRVNATLADFSTIEAQYIESFMARARRIGLTITPNLVGPEFIATAENLSDAIKYLRREGGAIGLRGQKFGVLGVSVGGVAAFGLAHPPLQWANRLERPDAVVTIAAAMAQPWRLQAGGPPCLMFNSDGDPVIQFRDAKMAALRAEQVGTKVQLVDTQQPGHLRQVDVVLDGADARGHPFRKLVQTHFAAMLSDHSPAEQSIISA